MNKEKMLEIANLLEKVEPESFHMGSWFGQRVDLEDYENMDNVNEEMIEDYGLHDQDFVNQVRGYKSVIVDDNVKDGNLKIACGTTACIAGWVVVNEYYKNPEVDITPSGYDYHGSAREILGLTSYEASQIFYCDWGSLWYKHAEDYGLCFDVESPETWFSVHPKHAADLLRRVATGEISFRNAYDDDEDL